MDDAPLTPYKLRVFCEVVERQSFTLAADHLFTTQPAISVHIRGLERYFGTRLIYREGRRSLPTGGHRSLRRSRRRPFRQISHSALFAPVGRALLTTIVRLSSNALPLSGAQQRLDRAALVHGAVA